MKISRNWLQTFFDAPLPPTSVLEEALTFHVFEIDGVESHEGDDVLDVKITPNRGHDCLSHYGIAKELSAILKIPLKETEVSRLNLDMKKDKVSVSIKTDLCKRYIAGCICGVKVGPSPEWLRARLEALGQRSINNVVDATNYVMFELGQPLHAFDASRLAAENGTYKMGVRQAKDGECMLALDHKEYTLDPGVMVIIDDRTDQAIGIAGVKGGMPAAINEETKDIIIESANFDGVSVRRAAQKLKLRTDASHRFEQNISSELSAHAMRMVADLIVKLAGGELVGFADVYPHPESLPAVSVSTEQVARVLGVTLTDADIDDVFTRLGFAYTKENGIFTVTPPFARLDLTIAEDLIEEVGRIMGYDKVPATPLDAARGKPTVNKKFYWSERLREFFAARGYSEVFTSVFADLGERIVQNKVDGVRPYLRAGLIKGVSAALEQNAQVKELLGVADVQLFEIGTVFTKTGESTHVAIGIAGKKPGKLMEALKQELATALSLPTIEGENIAQGSVSHAHQLAVFEFNLDALLPTLADTTDYDTDLPLSSATRFQPFSKYPYIVRDVACWTPAGTDAEEVLQSIAATAGELCVKAALFDRFEKEGRVSLGFRLIFQSFDRTLTDEDANTAMARVYAKLGERGFEIR